MSDSTFPTTRWSIVDKLSEGSANNARAALEALCNQYRDPLAKFLLLSGLCAQDDVEDVIQDFLAYFVEKESFQRADPVRGRLRTFLIGSLKNYASNARVRASALKRGGQYDPVPLEEVENHPSADSEPQTSFDRSWAIIVMNRAVERLKDDYHRRRKDKWYEEVSPFLEWEAETESYDSIAERLGVKSNRVALEVFRLKQRFREIIREEIGYTVGEQGDIEDELRYLARVLANDSTEA